MWTYRPADSTPTPRAKELRDPAPYSAARLQPSSAPFQTQNGAAPHRQSAFGQEQHTTGAVQSIFTALLYQQLGAAKGLVLQALVFWLPETLGSLFVILLSAFALHVSCGLLRCCLGQGGSGLGAASRCLIHRYLTICFVSMLVCGLSVLLTLVFGGLF